MGRKKKSEVPRVDKTLNIAELKQALDNAEKQIRIVKQLLFSELYKEKISTLCVDENVIEGIFDGAGMMGADGKKYLIFSRHTQQNIVLHSHSTSHSSVFSQLDQSVYIYKSHPILSSTSSHHRRPI